MADPSPIDQWLDRLQAAQPADHALRLTNVEAQLTTLQVALAAHTQMLNSQEELMSAADDKLAELTANLQNIQGDVQRLNELTPPAADRGRSTAGRACDAGSGARGEAAAPGGPVAADRRLGAGARPRSRARSRAHTGADTGAGTHAHPDVGADPVMSPEPDHARGDHVITGSPYETMQRLLARHLCGWISGHDAPVDHFLADAELIMREAHEHGVRFHLAPVYGSTNPADGFIEVFEPA